MDLQLLINNIQSEHHALLRRELPRLDLLLERLTEIHGTLYPELSEAAQTFRKVRSKIEIHLGDEERLLFPVCLKLENGENVATLLQDCNLLNRLNEMEQEHESSARVLANIRNIVDGVALQTGDSSGQFQSFIDGLAELLADLQVHVQKENDQVHPRARQLLSAMRLP